MGFAVETRFLLSFSMAFKFSVIGYKYCGRGRRLSGFRMNIPMMFIMGWRERQKSFCREGKGLEKNETEFFLDFIKGLYEAFY